MTEDVVARLIGVYALMVATTPGLFNAEKCNAAAQNWEIRVSGWLPAGAQVVRGR
jgi:hypothetical protein